jgi:hypothetical protein
MENLGNLINWTKRKQFRGFKGKYVVYKFTNLVNNKVYIGITDWINKRIGDHIRYSKNTNSKCRMYLHRAIPKYGFDKFTFEIIEIVSTREELNQREIYWINYFNSTNNSLGYNLTKGGNTNYPSEETIQKKILSSKKVKVAQYDLQGNFINKFESVKEASRQLEIPDTDIHRCHNKKWSRKGFMFLKYENSYPLSISPYISHVGNNFVKDSYAGKNKVKCILISKEDNNIKFEANSITELSNISGICKSNLHRIYKNLNHKKWKLEKI